MKQIEKEQPFAIKAVKHTIRKVYKAYTPCVLCLTARVYTEAPIRTIGAGGKQLVACV